MTNLQELDKMIAQLEAKRVLQEEDLKDEVRMIVHNLQPMQLLKRAVAHIPGKKVAASALGLTLSAASGFLVKRFVANTGGGLLMNVGGNILKRVAQFGIFKKLAQR